jgi:hypothetical protein
LTAFHCARRLRVFARDILRLGVAMVGPYSSIRDFAGLSRDMAYTAERRQSRTRIVGELLVAKTGALKGWWVIVGWGGSGLRGFGG